MKENSSIGSPYAEQQSGSTGSFNNDGENNELNSDKLIETYKTNKDAESAKGTRFDGVSSFVSYVKLADKK